MLKNVFNAMSHFLFLEKKGFIGDKAMLEVAIQAVRVGCRVASLAQQDHLVMKAMKPDHSPVTTADYAVQACVSYILFKAYPGVKLLAEEDGGQFRKLSQEARLEVLQRVSREFPELDDEEKIADLIGQGSYANDGPNRESCFVLDPIDGTKGFIRGEQYAVCLGFLEADGTASLGVLGCPNMPADFFSADGKNEVGFLFEGLLGAGARVRSLANTDRFTELPVKKEVKPNEKVIFAESYEKSHTAGETHLKIFEAFNVEEEKDVLRIDSQVKFAALARGDVQVYLRFTGFLICTWDVLPGYVIVQEAGGKITNKFDQPLDFTHGRTINGNNIVATSFGNQETHEKIVSLVKSLEGK